ncbi:hypothetical protein HDU96_010934 [Phlyctochytrium bullatum]|nr:hypothetical protein HDU96_010934 [Phlyctochytrium bullatum]
MSLMAKKKAPARALGVAPHQRRTLSSGKHFTLAFGGSVRPSPGGRGGWGAVWALTDPNSTHVTARLSGPIIGSVCSQIAEYSGVIHGIRNLLRHTKDADPRTMSLKVIGDCQSLIKGLKGMWQVRVRNDVHRYSAVARGLVKRFGRVEFEEVSRKLNKEADALAVRGTAMTLREDQQTAFHSSRDGLLQLRKGDTQFPASFNNKAGPWPSSSLTSSEPNPGGRGGWGVVCYYSTTPIDAPTALHGTSILIRTGGIVSIPRTTNNAAQYIALINGLQLVLQQPGWFETRRFRIHLQVRSNSELILNAIARGLARNFETVEYVTVNSSENRNADALARSWTIALYEPLQDLSILHTVFAERIMVEINGVRFEAGTVRNATSSAGQPQDAHERSIIDADFLRSELWHQGGLHVFETLTDPAPITKVRLETNTTNELYGVLGVLPMLVLYVEFPTEGYRPRAPPPLNAKMLATSTPPSTSGSHYTLEFDGSVRPNPGGNGGWGAAWTVATSESSRAPVLATAKLSGPVFDIPNDCCQIAEYNGLINGIRDILRHAGDADLRTLSLRVIGDSQTVFQGLRGGWEVQVKLPMHRYAAVANGLVSRFGRVELVEVRREFKTDAHALAARGRVMSLQKEQQTEFRPSDEGVHVLHFPQKKWAFTASFDRETGARSMVDAEFLADELGGGTAALEALEDPHPIVAVKRTWTRLAVLGVLPELELKMGGRAHGEMKVTVRNVLVVEGLPVPVHVAAGEEVLRQLREAMVPVRRGDQLMLLPARYDRIGALKPWG